MWTLRVLAIVKVEVMARTKGARFCLREGLRDLRSHLFGTKETLTRAQKGPLWVRSQGIMPGHGE